MLIPGFGVRINGARRWLGAGPLQFQPAEIMKLALVLHAGAMIAARPKLARSLRAAGPVFLPGAAAVLLIAAQPDLGTALVMLLHAGGDPRRRRPAAPPAGAGRRRRRRRW